MSFVVHVNKETALSSLKTLIFGTPNNQNPRSGISQLLESFYNYLYRSFSFESDSGRMEGYLDSPEFNSMLSVLLDDLASGEFCEQPQLSGSSEVETSSGNISYDTCSIGNDTKKYILTRVELNAIKSESKGPKKNVPKAKSLMGKPRMIKSDIRNSYAVMMSNTFNTLDLHSILGLFQTYSSADIKVRLKKRHPLTNQLMATELSGPLNLANLLFCNLTICPDCVTKLLSSRYDSESGVLTCNFQFSMTKVFNVHSIHQVLPNMVVEPGHAAAAGTDRVEAATTAINAVQIVDTFEEMKKSLPLRKKPVNVIHNVKLTIVTNLDKRMTEMRGTLHVVENDFSVEE